MSNKNTQAIVEGSLGAGISVIIFWLSYLFFPFIFLCSLPFLFLSYKWGFKISFISLIVSLTISSFILPPLNACFLYFPSGILGIVLGIGIKKEISLGKLFLLGGSIGLILEILTVLGGMLLFNISFEKVLGIDIMRESLKNSFKYLTENHDQFIKFINIIIPSLLILSAFFQVVINYWIAQKILIRFKLNIKPLPSLDTLRVPKKIWNILFIVLVFSIILSYFSSFGINIFNNGVFLLQFLLLIEGFFVIWGFLKKYIYSKIIRIFMVFIFLFNPILIFLLFIIGIIDIFYPIREKFLLREKI